MANDNATQAGPPADHGDKVTVKPVKDDPLAHARAEATPAKPEVKSGTDKGQPAPESKADKTFANIVTPEVASAHKSFQTAMQADKTLVQLINTCNELDQLNKTTFANPDLAINDGRGHKPQKPAELKETLTREIRESGKVLGVDNLEGKKPEQIQADAEANVFHAFEMAALAADKLPMTSVGSAAEALQKFKSSNDGKLREQLLTDLKLNPGLATQEDIEGTKTQLTKDLTDPKLGVQEKAKLEASIANADKVLPLQSTYEGIKYLGQAPSAVRFAYAAALDAGHFNSGDPPDATQKLEIYRTTRQAVGLDVSGDLQNAVVDGKVVMRPALDKLLDSSSKGLVDIDPNLKPMLQFNDLATRLSRPGISQSEAETLYADSMKAMGRDTTKDPKEFAQMQPFERAYKLAMDEVDKVGKLGITGHLAEQKEGPIKDGMAADMTAGASVIQGYANALAMQGRNEEALDLLTKLRGPERDLANTLGTDKSYDELLRKVVNSNVQDAQLMVASRDDAKSLNLLTKIGEKAFDVVDQTAYLGTYEKALADSNKIVSTSTALTDLQITQSDFSAMAQGLKTGDVSKFIALRDQMVKDMAGTDFKKAMGNVDSLLNEQVSAQQTIDQLKAVQNPTTEQQAKLSQLQAEQLQRGLTTWTQQSDLIKSAMTTVPEKLIQAVANSNVAPQDRGKQTQEQIAAGMKKAEADIKNLTTDPRATITVDGQVVNINAFTEYVVKPMIPQMEKSLDGLKNYVAVAELETNLANKQYDTAHKSLEEYAKKYPDSVLTKQIPELLKSVEWESAMNDISQEKWASGHAKLEQFKKDHPEETDQAKFDQYKKDHPQYVNDVSFQNYIEYNSQAQAKFTQYLKDHPDLKEESDQFKKEHPSALNNVGFDQYRKDHPEVQGAIDSQTKFRAGYYDDDIYGRSNPEQDAKLLAPTYDKNAFEQYQKEHPELKHLDDQIYRSGDSVGAWFQYHEKAFARGAAVVVGGTLAVAAGVATFAAITAATGGWGAVPAAIAGIAVGSKVIGGVAGYYGGETAYAATARALGDKRDFGTLMDEGSFPAALGSSMGSMLPIGPAAAALNSIRVAAPTMRAALSSEGLTAKAFGVGENLLSNSVNLIPGAAVQAPMIYNQFQSGDSLATNIGMSMMFSVGGGIASSTLTRAIAFDGVMYAGMEGLPQVPRLGRQLYEFAYGKDPEVSNYDFVTNYKMRRGRRLGP